MSIKFSTGQPRLYISNSPMWSPGDLRCSMEDLRYAQRIIDLHRGGMGTCCRVVSCVRALMRGKQNSDSSVAGAPQSDNPPRPLVLSQLIDRKSRALIRSVEFSVRQGRSSVLRSHRGPSLFHHRTTDNSLIDQFVGSFHGLTESSTFYE